MHSCSVCLGVIHQIAWEVKVKEYSSDWVEFNVMANTQFGSNLIYLFVGNIDEDQEILLCRSKTFFIPSCRMIYCLLV